MKSSTGLDEGFKSGAGTMALFMLAYLLVILQHSGDHTHD